jgi:hypothetical protein
MAWMLFPLVMASTLIIVAHYDAVRRGIDAINRATWNILFLNEDFGASTTPWYAAQQGRHQISAITLDTDLLLQELY